MSEHVRLIVGLGNPGERYRNTWHNLGARTVEVLAARWGIEFKAGRGEFLAAETTEFGKVTLMLPTSFMNRSGSPVGAWIRYHKVDPNQVLVIYDDHDIPLGRLRLREAGSAGGHRGMEDIIRSLGGDAVPRLRIGISTGLEHPDLADQVLTKIPRKYEPAVERVIETASDAALEAVIRGVVASGNKFNGIEIA